MKIEKATVSACEQRQKKDDHSVYFILHVVSDSTGFVYRVFSDTAYPKDDCVSIVPNYPKFGSAGLVDNSMLF